MKRRTTPLDSPTIQRLLLAVLSAALSALLGASHSLGAWISGVPAMVAIRQASVRESLLCGLVAGGLCTAVTAWGLRHYSLFLYLAAVAIIGGFVAVAAAMIAWLGRGRTSHWTWIFIPPLVWVPLASIRSLVDLPLSSNVAGSQADFPAILQIAALTGPSGISFLLALGNAVIAQAMSFAFDARRGRPVAWRMWSGLGLTALVFIGGAVLGGTYYLMRHPTNDQGIKVAVVQGGLPIEYYHRGAIDQTMKQLLRDRYAQLTQFAGTSKPELVIWPEEPTLGDLLAGDRLDPAIVALAKKQRAMLLIGSSTSERGGPTSFEARFNSALLISDSGELLARYDKRRPTPFEPYRPGHRSPLLHTPAGLTGLLICEESLYPSLPRDLVRQGAGVLMELSNDAGFSRSPLAVFHAHEAVLTAVTYHRPYVRAGQSGPSYLIDQLGRIQAESAPFESTVLVGLVSSSSRQTVALRWSEWFPVLCLGLSVGLALGTLQRRG